MLPSKTGQSPTTDDLPLQLRLERPTLSADAALRLAFGVVALSAGLWLFLVDPPWPLRLLSLLALLFGGLWIARFVKALRASGNVGGSLELTEEGLTLDEHGHRSVLLWHNVSRIEQDQDALMVCVVPKDGKELRVEPEYGGLGLEVLSQLLYRFLVRSRTCTGPDTR